MSAIARLLFLYLFVAILGICNSSVYGQYRDTIKTDTVIVQEQNLPKHSPTKASIFSALLPGLGQAYNRKYWKIPIVYAGIAIPLYYAIEQNDLYTAKYDAYRNRLNGDSSDVYLTYGNFYSNDGLLKSLDVNRRNRDLMLIITGAIYLLQIVDASVDAHLFYFDVNDDLSLHYSPYIYYSQRNHSAVKGVSLNLYF